MTAPDTVTVLRSVDGAKLTKTITRAPGGGFDIQPYDRCTWVAVEQVPVDSIVSVGRLNARLENDPRACIIRGRPKPGINLERTRRLIYDHRKDDGSVTPATFDAAAPRLLAIDVDSLPTPEWCPEALARRRAALLALGKIEDPPKGADDGEDYADVDLDPAPIDPVRDPEICLRAIYNLLPGEIRDTTCYYQQTSGAGIKPGVRMRLWFWCDRGVSDAEAKRWLKDCPVDLSLYNPVQPHYVSKPLFRPASLDPVPVRSGFFWRHVNEVPVPELAEPAPPPQEYRRRRRETAKDENRRVYAYAEACISSVRRAPPGERHKTLRSVAITLFGMVENELLEEREAWADLDNVTRDLQWPSHRAKDLLVWCRAKAAAEKPLPQGWQK